MVRNLGVWFDSDFSFLKNVQNICKSCFAQIRDLKHLRGYLTHHAALMTANALVGSRLDYCNSLFRSLSALDLRKLQCVQNSLARIVTNTAKYSHITPVRKILHWLPIEHRSVFKTALLVYKFLHCGHPKYFAPFLKSKQRVSNTHKSQADGVFLEVPHFATSIYKSSKHFGLSFAYDAPKIWNDLPDDVRLATSLHSFRRKLKTYLFHKHIHPNFCFPWFLPVALTLAMSQVYDFSFLLSVLVCLESIFRWRLGAIKILLELEYNTLRQVT